MLKAFGSDKRGVLLNTISRSAYIQQLNHFLRFFAIVFCRFVPFICSSIKRCGQFFQRQNLRSDSKHCRRLRFFRSERSACTSFKQKCSYLKHCYGDWRAGCKLSWLRSSSKATTTINTQPQSRSEQHWTLRSCKFYYESFLQGCD